jgi:hypothetical protein
VLVDFVALLDLCEDEEACDEANFRDEIMQPWGRRKQMTECYAITLESLFDDTPELESVLTTAKRDYGAKFDYTRRQLETAIARFKVLSYTYRQTY